jgi:hypothetical protein
MTLSQLRLPRMATPSMPSRSDYALTPFTHRNTEQMTRQPHARAITGAGGHDAAGMLPALEQRAAVHRLSAESVGFSARLHHSAMALANTITCRADSLAAVSFDAPTLRRRPGHGAHAATLLMRSALKALSLCQSISSSVCHFTSLSAHTVSARQNTAHSRHSPHRHHVILRLSEPRILSIRCGHSMRPSRRDRQDADADAMPPPHNAAHRVSLSRPRSQKLYHACRHSYISGRMPSRRPTTRSRISIADY